MRYELIIYWSKDDGCFVVEVPELPGCMADGQTYAEAVANAEEIIEEWIAVTQSRNGGTRPGFPTARPRILRGWGAEGDRLIATFVKHTDPQFPTNSPTSFAVLSELSKDGIQSLSSQT